MVKVNHGGPNPVDGMEKYNKATVIQYIKDHAFFLNEEVTELMVAVGGGDRAIIKPWAKRHSVISSMPFMSDEKIKSEAIDMLCFCLNICLAAGITPENIEEEYNKVWQKNIDRQSSGY